MGKDSNFTGQPVYSQVLKLRIAHRPNSMPDIALIPVLHIKKRAKATTRRH